MYLSRTHRPSLTKTLGGASAVLATLPALDQSTSTNRSRACLDATRRLAAWLASWGERWGGNPILMLTYSQVTDTIQGDA